MLNKEYRLTQEGLDKLETELEQLQVRTKEVADDIAIARQQGDLSENAEYQNAKDEQRKVQRRIKEINAILASSEVVEPPTSNDEVVFGSTVELSGSDGDVSYQVVGSLEANPAESKISDESPIGRALLGAKKGQTVSINLPANTKQYTVESIS
jgi:transcription elongation factor GreA